MNGSVDSSFEQFAVIESRLTDRDPERFVLAYHDEESLRELIAARNIIAVGFTSRENAINGIEACLSAGTPWQQVPKRTLGDGAGYERRGFHSEAHRLGSGFAFAEAREIVLRVLQHAAAAAMLIFYSRNAISAAIRTLIGV